MLSSSILVRTGRSATTVGSRVIMGPKAFLHRQWLTTTTTGRPPAPRVLPKSTTTPAQPHKLASQVSEAGSGLPLGGAGGGGGFFNLHNKTPVSWTSLFVVSVVAATAVTYYKIERERRLESAMGKVVSSELDGWTPNAVAYAKRQFIKTKYGWFPKDDGWEGVWFMF